MIRDEILILISYKTNSGIETMIWDAMSGGVMIADNIKINIIECLR